MKEIILEVNSHFSTQTSFKKLTTPTKKIPKIFPQSEGGVSLLLSTKTRYMLFPQQGGITMRNIKYYTTKIFHARPFI